MPRRPWLIASLPACMTSDGAWPALLRKVFARFARSSLPSFHTVCA